MITASARTMDSDMAEFLLDNCVQAEIHNSESADRAEEFSDMDSWQDRIVEIDDEHAEIVELVHTMDEKSCVAFLEIIQPRLNDMIRHFGTDSIDVEFVREIVRRVRNRVVFPDQKFATAALVNSAKRSTNRTWEMIIEDDDRRIDWQDDEPIYSRGLPTATNSRLMGKRTTQPQPRKYKPVMSGRSIEELREEWSKIRMQQIRSILNTREIMGRIK